VGGLHAWARAVAPPHSTFNGSVEKEKHQLKRHVKVGVLALVAVSTLSSRTPTAGGEIRVHRSAAASRPDASGPIKFITNGTVFEATNPQAGVSWNPAQTVTIDPPAEA
jgi:hypothetical protein